jgi:uncharacterized protein (TIGR03083 family)
MSAVSQSPGSSSAESVGFDPRRGGRLLRAEAAAILPVLRALPATAFDTPTLLPGWSVRDVLAHCSAAFKGVTTGQLHDFSPASNEKDVAHRRDWSVEELLDELTLGYQSGAAAIEAVAPRLDALALGEWIHGGDIRDALGMVAAYASDGVEDALVLLGDRSRVKPVPPTDVTLTGAEARLLRLGPNQGPAVATVRTDPATLFRLCAGRQPDPARFTITGAAPADYLIFN